MRSDPAPDPAPDPAWFLDHVVVPGGIDRRPVGPVRARQADWLAEAARLGGGDAADRLAVGQGFVLRRRDALACGLSTADVRRMVARRRWTSLGHGVVTVLPPDDDAGHEAQRRRHALASAAAVLTRADHVVGAGSAAVVHGLPVRRMPERPDLLVRPMTTTGRRATARVLRPRLPDSDVAEWFGAPVTTVPRTIVDLARVDATSGLMAADAALHERLIVSGDLDGVLAGMDGQRWIRRAREVLALASPLAESPLESLTRLVLHDAGFPAPALQVVVPGADGRSYRVDFLWEDDRLVLEADGRQKYTGDALWAEKRREQALRRAGYRVERVVWSDVTRDWARTSEYLWSLLRRTR